MEAYPDEDFPASAQTSFLKRYCDKRAFTKSQVASAKPLAEWTAYIIPSRSGAMSVVNVRLQAWFRSMLLLNDMKLCGQSNGFAEALGDALP